MQVLDKKVLFIEDNKQDALLYKQLLEQSERIELEIIAPYSSVDEYAYLAGDPATGAVLLDMYLSHDAGVNYEGIHVAEFLRTLSAELPIIILTQYVNDVDQAASEAIDSVWAKKDVSAHAEPYVTRIVRSMQRYDDALTDRQRALQELIDKKLAGTLSEEEATELAQLRRDIVRPADYVLAERSDLWEDHLQELGSLVADLQRMSDNIDALDKE